MSSLNHNFKSLRHLSIIASLQPYYLPTGAPRSLPQQEMEWKKRLILLQLELARDFQMC